MEEMCGPLLTLPWKVLAEASIELGMLSVLILLRWHPDRMSLAPGCSVWVSGVGWALCVCGEWVLCVEGGRDALGGGSVLCGWGYWELCVKAGRGCSRGGVGAL